MNSRKRWKTGSRPYKRSSRKKKSKLELRELLPKRLNHPSQQPRVKTKAKMHHQKEVL